MYSDRESVGDSSLKCRVACDPNRNPWTHNNERLAIIRHTVVFQCPSNKWPCLRAAKRVCRATRSPGRTPDVPAPPLQASTWWCGSKSRRPQQTRTTTRTTMDVRPPSCPESQCSREFRASDLLYLGLTKASRRDSRLGDEPGSHGGGEREAHWRGDPKSWPNLVWHRKP